MIELSNCVWIPRAEFDQRMRDQLTVKVFKMNPADPPEEVCAWRTDRRGYIGLPRVYGLKLISNRKVNDARSNGHSVKFKKTISLRDYQEPFVASIIQAAETRTDFRARAGTGKGKTVCGLSVIQKLGRSAVIIVDQENLLDQWVERCVEHLGMDRKDIGIVQGPTCEYAGKAITICMMQTLTRKVLPEDFYSAFGIVIFDESHTAGAPTFSETLMAFAAKVRFGLSATPERRDALEKLLTYNLGTIDVVLIDEHNQSSVYIMESYGTYSWRVNNSKMMGEFINEVADDSVRNLELAYATKWLFESGRDVLVISDRIEHLCSLMALCEAIGMPRSSMGLYAKSRTVFRYEKDPRPPRRPPGWEKGTEYSPVRLSLLQKAVPKKELAAVMATSRVIFATYGVMAKGVDIPRLSAGIDATPRSEATQVLGRVLRTNPGKLRPIWVTIADMNSFRSLHQLRQRLMDYDNSNAEVFLWVRTKGRKRLNLRDYRKELADRISLLRQSQIITNLEGNNTLVIPNTVIDSANSRGRPTGRIGR